MGVFGSRRLSSLPVPFQELLVVVFVHRRLVGLARQEHLRNQYGPKDGNYP